MAGPGKERDGDDDDDVRIIDAAGHPRTTVVIVTDTAKQRSISPVAAADVAHGEPAIVVTT